MCSSAETILYFQFPWAKWRERLAGVYRYATRRKWQIVKVEYGRNFTTIKDVLRFWKPDGCLVENDYLKFPTFDCRDFGDTPVVYFDPSRSQASGGHYGVIHDFVQTAVLGVKELLSLGFDDYAYVHYFQPREWSDRRCGVMKRMMAKAGKRLIVFGGDFDSFDDCFQALAAFLRTLPKPCGLFAANDDAAATVLNICRNLRIRVPEDISVIGVDDDELVCENTQPRLTSVKPDFELSGYLAAKLLDECMVRRDGKGKMLRFGPKLLVRRGSSSRFKRRDDDARQGLEFIRENLTTGISAIDVVRVIGGSRRNAEKRFLKLTGHSIGAEIAEQRLTLAKRLLMKRDVPIGGVYSLCGYGNPETLRRAFKLATGCSLREWRDSDRR